MDDKTTNALPKYATTYNDKYLVLQARDKFVRSQRIKQTDLKTAKVVTGTCQDMCPEYERYCRINRNCVSILEKTNDQPDEFKMVKEYVRSGADQEEPLSYELRPPDILDRTMLYLAANIIDLIDNEEEDDDDEGDDDDQQAGSTLVGTWYNFLWNRLRAIRKDITQQDLNGLSSVHLMECCVRFHIYAAHRLVEAEASIFDQKINDDGLRKSLQSLKDFYYDLSLKNIECLNEAEFRSYDIILNLRENDAIRDISRYRKSVRNSEQVQFAIKVHAAFNDNNYVKFFNLLKQASFLDACVMHRHFNAIRFHAIYILRRALVFKDQREQIPIENLFYQLCFQDDNEFVEFCNSMKLEIDGDNIILTRMQLDELPKVEHLLNKRSLEYIEIKKDKKLSEIIYGAVIDAAANPYKKHKLQNSFDTNDQLIETEIKLDDKLIKINQNVVNEYAIKNAQAKILAASTALPPLAMPSSSTVRSESIANKNKDVPKNLFGGQTTGNIFGSKMPNLMSTNNSNSDLFGKSSSSSSLFGNSLANKESSSSKNLFSNISSSLFSKPPSSSTTTDSQKLNEMFHFKNTSQDSQQQQTSSLFKLPELKEQDKEEQQAIELRLKEEEAAAAAERRKANEKDLQSVVASTYQALLDDVLGDLIKKNCLDLCIAEESIRQTNLILTETVFQLIHYLSAMTYQNERILKNRLNEMVSALSNEFSIQYLNEEISNQVKSIAKQVYLEELNKFLLSHSKIIANAYFEEAIHEVVFEICSTTYESDLLENRRIVNYIRLKRGWRLAGDYFRYWKRRCDYLKRFRYIRDNFPGKSSKFCN